MNPRGFPPADFTIMFNPFRGGTEPWSETVRTLAETGRLVFVTSYSSPETEQEVLWLTQ